MKKKIFPILTISALLFTTACEDRGTSTEVVSANEDEEVNPAHIRGYGDREPGGTAPADPEANQMYAFDTDAFSAEIRNDLGVEGGVATEMVKVYYDQNRQLSEMEQRYRLSETARMGGQDEEDTVTGSATAPMSSIPDGTQTQQPDMDTERERIHEDTDKKIKDMLTPEQYKQYQKNRSKYQDMTQPRGGNMRQGGNTQNGNNQNN